MFVPKTPSKLTKSLDVIEQLPTTAKLKKEDLSAIVSAIKGEFGSKSSIQLASSESDVTDYISTGSKVLDISILSEGIPAGGKITELLGLFSSGKSLLLQMLMANAQRDYDAICVLADRENAYTKNRGAQIGIDNDKLIVVGPKDIPTADLAFNFLCTSARKIRKAYPDRLIFLALDSIAAFDKPIKTDKAGKTSRSKSDMGKKAKLVHEGMRQILNDLDANTCFVFCNQITYMPGTMFGNPETSTSGEGPKYYPTIRLQLEQGRKLIDESRGKEVMGQLIKFKTIKSRLDAAYRQGAIPFYYATGIDYWAGYMRLLATRNIISTNSEKGPTAFKTFTHEGHTFKDGEDEKFAKMFPKLVFDTYPPWGSLTKKMKPTAEDYEDDDEVIEDED
jgi:protein RecA